MSRTAKINHHRSDEPELEVDVKKHSNRSRSSWLSSKEAYGVVDKAEFPVDETMRVEEIAVFKDGVMVAYRHLSDVEDSILIEPESTFALTWELDITVYKR